MLMTNLIMVKTTGLILEVTILNNENFKSELKDLWN